MAEAVEELIVWLLLLQVCGLRGKGVEVEEG